MPPKEPNPTEEFFNPSTASSAAGQKKGQLPASPWDEEFFHPPSASPNVPEASHDLWSDSDIKESPTANEHTTLEDDLGWGLDDLSQGKEGDVDDSTSGGVLERVRKHPKAAAGLLALTSIAAGAAMMMKGGGGDKPADSPNQIERTVDINKDGSIQSSERISQAEVDEIPELQNLPPVLDEPIRGKDIIQREKTGQSFSWDLKEGEIPAEIEQYKPEFVGAYKAVEGSAFNFYAATQPGEEAALDQDFQINPQSVEYILEQISSDIGNAPENPAKQAIIKNLRGIKSGEKEGIINIVVDVSPTAGCLDADQQLIKFVETLCSAEGAAAGITKSSLSSIDGKSIILPLGGNTTIVTKEASAAQKKEFEKTFKNSGSSGLVTMKTKTVPDIPRQQETGAHEMVHALSGIVDKDYDTYREGDPDHEITAWLVDGDSANSYDFKGATGPSPNLGEKIEKLVAAGELPPILSVKK